MTANAVSLNILKGYTDNLMQNPKFYSEKFYSALACTFGESLT